MASLKQFKTDAALEEQGTVIEIADGITVQVRSEMSKKVRQWNIARWRKDRALYMNGSLPGVDHADKVEIDKCVEVLVLDWDGVTEDEVTPIACTPETIRRVMTDYPLFRRAIIAGAGEVENFRSAEVAALAKNSGTPSTLGSVAASSQA